MACAVETVAQKTEGKKVMAVEAFARALRQIPIILADNAGYDSSDLVTRLRAAHYGGQSDAGLGEFTDSLWFEVGFFTDCVVSIDMEQGTIGSMRKLGVTESYKLKRQVVSSASEAAEMIIRCVTFIALG